jgi:hypothetical protein
LYSVCDTCLCLVSIDFLRLSEHLQSVLGIYDADNETDVHCFQTVFVPAVQHSVDIFIDSWNNHYIRNRGVPRRNYLACLRGVSSVELDYDVLYEEQVSVPRMLP